MQFFSKLRLRYIALFSLLRKEWSEFFCFHSCRLLKKAYHFSARL